MASNIFDGVAERLDSLKDSLGTPTESLIIRDRHEWQRVPAVMATHRAALALVAGDADSTLVLADEAFGVCHRRR